MANRYRKRQIRSRTPEPISGQNPAWMPTSPRMPRSRIGRRSLGGWGSMGNLDQIMNTLQESIHQKQKECYSSFESLDNLSDEDDDSGIRMTDSSSSRWKNSASLVGVKCKQDPDDPGPRLPRRKSQSLHGSRESLVEHDPDYRTSKRMLPKVDPSAVPLDESKLKSKIQFLIQADIDSQVKALSTLEQSENRNGYDKDTSESADTGLHNFKLSYKNDVISDNWIMKPAKTDPKPASVTEVKFMPFEHSANALTLNDDNNNNPEQNHHFIKNPNLAAERQEVSSRRRSRWDCTSPVVIKREDSKTEVLSKDEQPESGGKSRQLPNFSRSRSVDAVSNSSNSSSSLTGRVLKSTARNSKPSPAVVPNQKFRRGFDLNAQLQKQIGAPCEGQQTPRMRDPENQSRKSKWERTQVGPSILFQAPTDPASVDDSEEKSGGTMLFISGREEASDVSEHKATDGEKADVANKHYDAFFVSCNDESQSETKAKEKQTPARNDSEMTDEERAIKFPQWVIPFIDDNLTGRFECGTKRQAANKKNAESSAAGRQVTSPVAGRQSRSKSPSPLKSSKESSPVPPPRTKRTAAMNRILQEKDDLACRERPLPEKPERSKTPTIKLPERVKSPVRAPKKLPRLPSESSSLSTDSSEQETFTVHYVQHNKGPTVALTKGVTLRTNVSQKQQDDRTVSQRSRASSRTDLSRIGLSASRTSTPKSALTSKRSKSMENLTLLSQNKRGLSGGGTQAAGSRPSPARMDSTSSGSPTENRAMRALREAMSSRSTPPRSSGQTAARHSTTTTASSTGAADVASVPSRARNVTPADRPAQHTVRSRSRSRLERQDSTDSENSNPTRAADQQRARMRTPVRRSVSLKDERSVRIIDGDSLTLPRRRPRPDAASVHAGGYSTLKSCKPSNDLPKKSILKKRLTAAASKPGPDVTSSPESRQQTTSSGKRVLPPPPDDVDVDLDGRLLIQSWMSTSVDNLNLSWSTSMDRSVGSPPPSTKSRTSSTSSSDGSILSLRRTAFTSSRDNLFKRTPAREQSGLGSRRDVNTGNTSLSSSRESLVRGSDTKSSSTTAGSRLADRSQKARGLSGSQECLLKKASSRESLASSHRSPTAKANPPKDPPPKPPVRQRLRTTLTKSGQSASSCQPPAKPPKPKLNVPLATSSGDSGDDSVFRSPTLSKSGLHPVDSIKKHKKTLHAAESASNHKMSDRFRKLVEGDITDLASPPPPSGKSGTLSERENSFDSGVEFVMHL